MRRPLLISNIVRVCCPSLMDDGSAATLCLFCPRACRDEMTVRKNLHLQLLYVVDVEIVYFQSCAEIH